MLSKKLLSILSYQKFLQTKITSQVSFDINFNKERRFKMSNFEIVETQYGPVRGIHKNSSLGTDYISFQGIPYMTAPLGVLRFKDARMPKSWTEPFNATEEPPSYCQFNMISFEREGQENAGTINVYTKKIEKDKLRPVMVYVSFYYQFRKIGMKLFLGLENNFFSVTHM